MKAYQVIEPGLPLEENIFETPVPQGTEILLKTIACGVCHSDVHIHEGHFDLGGGNKLPMPLPTPYTLGHEIFGEVVAIGEKTQNVAIGEKYVAFPWIGCGNCNFCLDGDGNLCNAANVLGIHSSGGFGDHVLVPHSKYLFDKGDTPDELAGSYACSGLTAYSALKKVIPLEGDNSLVIIGAGGVGMMALQIAQAAFSINPIVVDIDDQKLNLAKNSGASLTFNSTKDETFMELFEATGGGAISVIDFVGAESSANLGYNLLRKGGTLVIVGLFGGQISLPLPMIPIMSKNLLGSYVGNLQEMTELMKLVKEGKVDPIPVISRPASEADQTLKDLKEGKILGRASLIY
ncbi:MAG: alcohol dehydrogenase [SAR86 cluster bacterium]|nr:alcohol dehydrogenase [SAR86 cluster bacterium]